MLTIKGDIESIQLLLRRLHCRLAPSAKKDCQVIVDTYQQDAIVGRYVMATNTAHLNT